MSIQDIHFPSDKTNQDPLAPIMSPQAKILEGKQAIPIPTPSCASEASIQKHILEKLSPSSIPQMIATLKKEKIEIEKLVDATTSLSRDYIPSTQEVVGKIAAEAIQKIILEGVAENFSSQEASVAVYKKNLDLSGQMKPFLIEEGFIREFPELELAVVGTNILSRGSVIFTSGMLLNKIEEAIEAKEHYLDTATDEAEIKAVKQEISILKKWAKVRLSMISSSLKETAIQSAFSSPKVLSAIVVLTKATETVISRVIDWFGLGLGLVCAAVSFHESRVNFKTHEVWTTIVGIKGEGVAVEDLDRRKATIDAIIERQKKIFVARFESNHPVLAKRLRAVLPDLDVASFSNENWKLGEVPGKLNKAGIDPSEIDGAINDLKKAEMLSLSLRKGLLAFNQKKDEIDKGFLQQTVNKSAGLLTMASVITGAVIVLKALLIAGVIASTAALWAVGYGMLAAIVGTMIFGAVYLYIKKPNIFKTYVQGVQIKLFFLNIPMAIQNFRSHYAQLDEMRVSDQVNEIKGRILEAEQLLNAEKKEIEFFLNKHLPKKNTSGLNVDIILKKYMKKLKKTEKVKLKEAELLKKKISDLDENIAYFEAKLKPLEEQVAIAGWKDFQIGLKERHSELTVEEKSVAEVSSDDDAAILAEYLVRDIGLQEDSEMRKLLLHMDINPNTLSEEDSRSLKEVMAQKIRGFFAMETDETLRMINTQNLLVRHGLRENIAAG